MQIIKRVVFRLAIIGALFSHTLPAGIWGPVAVTELQKRADVIAVATVLDVSTDGTHAVSAQLHVTKIIQGQVAGRFMTVRLAPSGLMSSSGVASTIAGTAGATGIWFIQQGQGGAYRVLPTAEVDYSWEDAHPCDYGRLWCHEGRSCAATAYDCSELVPIACASVYN
jgi:hypothetical protein